MACDGLKYNQTCKTVYDTCVEVQVTVPDISSLSGSCNDLSSVIDDIYTLVDNTYIDMSSFVPGCLVGVDSTSEPIEVINTLAAKICAVEDVVDTLPTFDIANLDISCMKTVDPCGDARTITTLEDLLQAIVEDLCNCCNS
jgi:hypothetical protein